MMKTKKIMAKALAPIANRTAEKNVERIACSFVFNQPKMPAKLAEKVK